MPDTINTIVPEGTPTIYRAGRRAFMPDTIVLVGGHSCPIQSI